MSLLNGKFIRNIFVQETPGGTVDGVNTSFTVSTNPIFTSAHLLFVNGILLKQGVHYTISGNTITMTSAPANGQSLYSVYIRSL
jgi:hypothetical protein